MKRRYFIAGMVGLAAVWPPAAPAQQGAQIPRIGILAPGRSEGSDASRVTLNSLLVGLRDLGYREGQNIAIEREFGESNADRLRERAVELVKRKVDVIVAFSTTAARPAKQATSVIPIVAIAWPTLLKTTWLPALPGQAGMLPGRPFLARASRKTATVAQ